MRIGFAGLGHRGRMMMSMFAMHPQCQVAAICDLYTLNRTMSLAEISGDVSGIKQYDDYEKMLNSAGLDAVFIALPPDIQVDFACMAMEKGIHVCTEVPAAYSIEQCWKLVHTVEKTGVVYMLTEAMRAAGFIREWGDMARRNEFGHILYVEGEYMHYHEWDYFVDLDTGVTYDGVGKPPEGRRTEPTWRNRTFRNPIFYLPHTLSPLLYILDDRIQKVSCMGTRPLSYHVDDLASRDIEIALMHTAKDTVMKVATGFSTPHGPRSETNYHWYQVMGTKRTVEWTRHVGTGFQYDAGEQFWKEQPDWHLAFKQQPDFIGAGKEQHGGLDWFIVNQYMNALTKGEKVEMDVYRSVETAAPAILAAESSNEGGVLKYVPEFRPEFRQE